MDKFLENPWFLRLTALFLAILLFYTVQVEENEKRKTSTTEDMEVIREIPVEVYYDDENLIVTGVPETVSMAIEGPTNLVQSTKLMKDYTLFVDLRTFTTGEHQVRIQHENISDKLQVRIDPSTIKVNVEEKITKSFQVEPEFNERLLADGYNVASIESDPSTIEITGAKNLIDSISYVKATVTADTGTTKSFDQETKVRVLDRELNKIDVESEPESVTVKVKVEENVKEVPIVLRQVGKPPKDVNVQSLKPETEKIALSGPNRVLNEIDQFIVDIDMSKISKSETLEVKLDKPKEITSMSHSTLKVKVKTDQKGEEEPEEEASEANDTSDDTSKNEQEMKEKDKEKEKRTEDQASTQSDEQTQESNAQKNEQTQEEQQQEKEEVVRVSDVPVVVRGLSKKYKSSFIQPESGVVTITVRGKSNFVKDLTKDDFVASVDVSKVEEGETTIPLYIEGPSEVDWTASVEKATVKIELA